MSDSKHGEKQGGPGVVFSLVIFVRMQRSFFLTAVVPTGWVGAGKTSASYIAPPNLQGEAER